MQGNHHQTYIYRCGPHRIEIKAGSEREANALLPAAVRSRFPRASKSYAYAFTYCGTV